MKHPVLLPHPNASRLSNRQLAAAITFTEQSSHDRSDKGEAVAVGDVVKKVVTGIYFRQQCVNVLRERLKRHFNQEVIDRLAKRDSDFAKVFCEKHLGRPFTLQSELGLTC